MPDTVRPGEGEDLSPIVFYYFDLNGTDTFMRLLEERFRQAGGRRPIDFREWDCYEELPGEDGDLFAYDGIVLSALAAKGLLMPVPDEITVPGVFPWITENSRYRGRSFGAPIMMCSNALVCRKKDERPIRSIMDLHENVAVPIHSMLMFYYIQALCSNRDVHRSLRVMEHLVELIGGRDFLEDSGRSSYDGVARFNAEQCRYFLGFTEDILHCRKDDYSVRFEDFSSSRRSRRTLFMVDFVSVARRVPDEKLQDCLTLMKIMTDEQFTYGLCVRDGRPQYMLPANMRLFPRLAALDPLYDRLFGMLDSGDNGVLRYGRRYYEDFNRQEALLLQLLSDIAGWKDQDALARERLRALSSHFCGRRRPVRAPLPTPPEGPLHGGQPKEP